MVKKKGLKKFNISNKLAYTLMVVLSIALLGIGVYANTVGTAPNPGHLLSTLSPDSSCSSGQVLSWNGVNIVCATPSATDSRFTINSNGLLCYDNPYSGCGLLTGACAMVDLWIPISTGGCASMTQSTMRPLCAAQCPVYACNGATTPCPGGTFSALIVDVNCEADDVTILCHCFGGGGTYQQEYVIAPGQRCI